MKLTLEIDPSDDTSETLLQLMSIAREKVKKELKKITQDESLEFLENVEIKEFYCSGEINIKITFKQ
jgi:hypothetical protein